LPDELFTHDTSGNLNDIDIEGSQLYFPNATTSVLFRHTPTDPNVATYNVTGGQVDEFSNVKLPSALTGLSQIYAIVKVNTVESNAFLLKLNDRLGPMTAYSGSSFIMPTSDTTIYCPNN
tara:strand:+ start:251 stop:610 length:360 start_codon:yes stop_codon:yes gene_type:complete